MSDTTGYTYTMGRIAQTLRQLVGGRDTLGYPHPAADIVTAAELLKDLRALLDQYDSEMVKAGQGENRENENGK